MVGIEEDSNYDTKPGTSLEADRTMTLKKARLSVTIREEKHHVARPEAR